jgi:hypothetical protein
MSTPFAPQDAESVGARLKTELTAAGIRARSAIVVVGRDQVLCRDLRYPAVPDEERPSVVQFQALKEITLTAEEAIIDFLPLSLPWPTGEQRALAFVLRRGQLAACQRLCQAAGLKLEAVVPSSIAVLANALPLFEQAAAAVGIVAAHELLVVHRQELIYTRPLNPEEPLPTEVRRALAGYAAVHPNQPVHELYVASGEAPGDAELVSGGANLPMRAYDPLGTVRTATPPIDALPLLPAIGAVQAATAYPRLPVNFAQPKKNHPRPNRRRVYYVGAAAAALGILLLGGGFYLLSAAEYTLEINSLQKRITEKKAELAKYGNLEEKAKTLSDWTSQEVIVLDELYELAARFPDAAGIRILRAEWSPIVTAAANTPRQPVGVRPGATQPSLAPFAQVKKNTKPIGTLMFEVQADSPEKLNAFRRELDRGHWSVDQWERDQGNANHILAWVKVFPQEAHEYVAKVQLGKHRTQPGEIRPEGTRPGRFGTTRTPNRGGRP